MLLVEDEAYVRQSLTAVLTADGFTVIPAESGEAALRDLETAQPDVIITDLRMPRGDGHTVIQRVAESGLAIPVIVLTGAGTVSDAVRALRNGVHDFLEKPVDPERLAHALRRALEHVALARKADRLESTVTRLRSVPPLVGRSPAMQRVRRFLEQVAPTEATVLITGESGTGKELVAEAIHQASPRGRNPSVRVNCAAVADGLFESEYFGHERGAFTGALAKRIGHFAAASGSTLMLDEIGTLPAAQQAKLLRVLESGEFQPVGSSRSELADVRVIAVTNEDLSERRRDGRFREDLFHRLAVFPIDVPPLRERLEDLADLVPHLLARLRPTAPVSPVSPRLLEVLASYPWPGNVRELRNVLERCLILGDGDGLTAELVSAVLAPPPRTRESADLAGAGGPSLDLEGRKRALERALIREALERARGRKSLASELLGIDPRNLAYYLKKHDLTVTPEGSP